MVAGGFAGLLTLTSTQCANAVTINLSGVGAGADLRVTSGNNGYETANIVSGGGAQNTLDFDVNFTSLATINVSGAQTLFMTANSTALDLSTLVTFNGTAATGDLIIGFPGVGSVVVNGGSGNDVFQFPGGNGGAGNNVTVRGNAGNDTFVFLTNDGGGVTFNAGDTADGGPGTNRLHLQVDTGAILAAGVGAGILNIQTIEHFTFDLASGDVSADMAQSGSATVLELAGLYNDFDVTVTNLLNADNVIMTSGGNDAHIFILTLSNASALGTINFTMAQTATGGTQTIHNLVTNGLLLNLASAGNAALNDIDDVAGVDANHHRWHPLGLWRRRSCCLHVQ